MLQSNHFFSNSPVISGFLPEVHSYGFNGMERNSEVESESYFTHHRILDSRLGRWMSVDPKYYITQWESPYCSMGSNPMMHTDLLGDWYGKKTERKIQKIESKIDKRINEIDEKITSIKATMTTKNAQGDLGKTDHSENQTVVNELEERKQSLQDAKLEINDMRNDRLKEYRIKTSIIRNWGNQRGGDTDQPDKDKGNLVILHMGLRSKASTKIHELKHAHQIFMGDLSRYPKSNVKKTYDIYDEVDAYQRQFSFSPEDVKAGFARAGIQISNSSDISPDNVINLGDGDYDLPIGRYSVRSPYTNKKLKK